MKKFLSLLLAALMLLSMAACGGATDSENKNNPGSTENSGSVAVDKGLLTVDVTMAASFFEDMTAEEIKAEAEENGYSSCTVNPDGSVTYTMTKAKHKEMLDDLKSGIEETIAGCLEGEDKVASFVSIEHADDYSRFDVCVDPAEYSLWDNLYALAFYLSGAYYQAFTGVASDKIDVVVNFIDNNTKEILDSGSYRNFISNTGTEDETDETVSSADATPIAVQQTISIPDVCEFYVDYSDITSRVMPPQPGDWYSYYGAEDGKVYVDFCVAYKNLETTSVDADSVISAKLMYADKYEYTGFSMIEEDSRSDFTYSNITSIAPLTTEYLHYLFEVPAEVETSGERVEIFFVIGGNTYSYSVR